MKPGGRARFPKRLLRCGYIAARRRWLRELRGRGSRPLVHLAPGKEFKRSKDADVSEQASEWPVLDSVQWFQGFLQAKDSKPVSRYARGAERRSCKVVHAGVVQIVAQFPIC